MSLIGILANGHDYDDIQLTKYDCIEAPGCQ